MENSRKLLEALWDQDAKAVAAGIENVHDEISILQYHDENSLSCVLTMAYFTAPAYYNIVREMPAGKGYADMVFIPRKNAGKRPAIIIELKCDKTAEAAVKQIKDRHYEGALAGYKGKLLLVGINYDSQNGEKKHHTCVIEEYEK